MELVCEPASTTGAPRPNGRWSARTATPPTRRGAGQTIRLQTDMALGIEGELVRARHTLHAGRAGLLLAFVGRGPRLAGGHRRRQRADRRDDDGSGANGWRGARLVGPPLARADPALGAGDQGPHLHADRGDGRRAHHLAARDAGRRAQLGLPLHLDARLDLHPPGAALPQPRLGGRRVHAVRRRPRAQRGRRAADHVRDRRPPRPHRVDPRRPLRLRGSQPRCGSETAPSTSARTTSSARRSTRSCSTPVAASACRGGCGRSSSRRRSARPRSGASPTRASGRRAASPSTTSPRS